MRERWFGATGRRVPELALEGSLDLEGALVLDDVDDLTGLREAHAQGTPVVVRCDSRGRQGGAGASRGRERARPGEDLLALDLTSLTYG